MTTAAVSLAANGVSLVSTRPARSRRASPPALTMPERLGGVVHYQDRGEINASR